MGTADAEYAARLEGEVARGLRRWIDFQRPYRWNIGRLDPGRTLDVGCGVGRHLLSLPPGSMGVDLSEHAVARARARGANARTMDEFFSNPGESFDTILLSHVLEHMTFEQGREVLGMYLPHLKGNGRVIAICPQEKGHWAPPPGDRPEYTDIDSGRAHVTFLDATALRSMLEDAGLTVERAYSFPFPRPFGNVFRHNETVVVGRKCS